MCEAASTAPLCWEQHLQARAATSRITSPSFLGAEAKNNPQCLPPEALSSGSQPVVTLRHEAPRRQARTDLPPLPTRCTKGLRPAAQDGPETQRCQAAGGRDPRTLLGLIHLSAKQRATGTLQEAGLGTRGDSEPLRGGFAGGGQR